MQKTRVKRDKSVEKAMREILKSRARSRIYIYLLRKNGARSEQIIKGTRLHPSTVREILSKMYEQKLIYRKKLKNDSIGKNPSMYYAISPVKLLQKYASEIEDKLNKIASLAVSTDKSGNNSRVRIKIYKQVDKA